MLTSLICSLRVDIGGYGHCCSTGCSSQKEHKRDKMLHVLFYPFPCLLLGECLKGKKGV